MSCACVVGRHDVCGYLVTSSPSPSVRLSAGQERHRVKQLLAQQEVLFPHLFESLRAALRPLYSIGRTGLESRLFGRTVADEDSDDDDCGAAGAARTSGGGGE